MNSEIAKQIQWVDAQIGRRVKTFRVARNLSQGELAKQLNATCQEVQNFECGRTCISASQLVIVANILDVEIGEFLVNLTASGSSAERRDARARLAFMDTAECMALVDSYRVLPPSTRHRALQLIIAMAQP